MESCHQILATSRKESRELLPEYIYGMTHCCLEEGKIRSSEDEQGGIIDKCHASPYGGHFEGDRTTQKILQSGFYWPTLSRDCYEWVKHCDKCQRMSNINKINEMPLQGILVVQLFDIWGIDFMRPFSHSFGNLYILLAVDYVSKWVEAIACPRNDANTVVGFIQRNILSRFGASRAIISDEGSHFANKLFAKLMSRYGIRHFMGLAYHSIKWRSRNIQ